MRIRRYVIRKQVLCNYTILWLLCCYLIVTTSINIATTTYPLLHNVPIQSTNGCNGRHQYCDLTYDNITQIATHGSPFYGILPTHNQNFDVTTQLNAGIRFLQAQTRRGLIFGELKLCHTNCLIADAGALEDYLLTVKEWLIEHPQEVVSLLLTNGDFVDVGAFEEAFSKAGLSGLAYIPNSASTKTTTTTSSSSPSKTRTLGNGTKSPTHQWPTLGEMIRLNQRLVVFLDYGANPTHVPYLLREFQYFWETPYNTIDPTFPQCAIDRPESARESSSSSLPSFRNEVEQRMYIMNHYLDTRILGMEVPNRRDARKTNSVNGLGSIGAQAELCEELHGGKKPRIVLVNYFEVGEVLKAQDMLNGL